MRRSVLAVAATGGPGRRVIISCVVEPQSKQFLPGASSIKPLSEIRSGKLKRPIFSALRAEFSSSQDKLFDAVWTTTELLDGLALVTTEAFMTAREELISRQQQELLELSTPVVKLWDGILALPIIGQQLGRPGV